MNNNNRFDLSNYLIHFFRNIDLDSSSPVMMPEHMGFHNLYEDTSFPAFFMLRAALRNGRLWATQSIRNNQPTIYGPCPAVCFTEMPIAAFLEAGFKRYKNGQAMSPFAFVFPKDTLFKLGARPVISGLSKDVQLTARYSSEGYRMLPNEAMPPIEQYRYVTYNLGERNIDWTHEREWRFPYRGEISNYNEEIKEYGIVSNWDDIPGLDFLSNEVQIQNMGVIVQTAQQVQLIISDMLALVDSRQAHLHSFGFVLNASLLPSIEQLQHPSQTSQAISNAMVDLKPYFSITDEESNNFNYNFSKIVSDIEKDSGQPISGELGGCWLWLHDNTAPLTRALLRDGRVFVTKEGRYLAYLPEFSDRRGLRQREDMTKQLAESIQAEFNMSCCYFSVLNSNNAMEVPSYAGFFNEDISFFNCAWSASNYN